MASSTLKMPSLLPHHHHHHGSHHHLAPHPYRRRNALPDIYSGLQAAAAMEHLRGIYTSERMGIAAAVAVAVAAGSAPGARRASRSSGGVEQVSRQVESLVVGSPLTGAGKTAHCAISGC